MRIQYDAEADILLFILRDVPPVGAVEDPGGVIMSYGEDGEAVSVEFLHASARHLVRTGEIKVIFQADLGSTSNRDSAGTRVPGLTGV